MHFWHQRDITDRLIAERAARRERQTEHDDVQAVTAMLFDGHLPFRYDRELITITWVEGWDD